MTRKATEVPEMRPAQVLILGGAYGGMAAAMNLADLCAGKPTRFGLTNPQPSYKMPVEITIVDERDGYYHLIGSPLSFADERYAEKAWVRFDDITALQHPQFRCIQGCTKNVDPEKRVAEVTLHRKAETTELEYDFLVAATGLRRTSPSVPLELTRERYLKEVRPHIERISKAEQGVAVIGGGAVGIEMAAELKLVCPDIKVNLIHSQDRLLSSEPLPDGFKDQTLELVREAGVETIMGKRVQDTTIDDKGKKILRLSDNSTLTVSEVLNAISGPKPTTAYLPPSTLNISGEVAVNKNLTFSSLTTTTNASSHFAIGDLIPQSGVKRCGGAMHHGHYAAYNIHQQLLHDRGVIERPEYLELSEHGANIGLAVGKQAIGYSEQTGIMKGEETLGYLFGPDLGFNYCWDYLKLSEKIEDVEEAEVGGETSPEPEKVTDVKGETAVAVSAVSAEA